jgi:hypothetical protein
VSEQPTKEEMSIARLKRCHACIPLACEAAVADDIQAHLGWAIAEIERLRDQVVRLANEVEQLQETRS